MKTCLLYDSLTGNTKMLADTIARACGSSMVAAPEDADLVFLGSWTDRGAPTDRIASVAKSLRNKDVFLFGTCGFAGSDYVETLYQRFAGLLDGSNRVVGHFYCQGKMPLSSRRRYEAQLAEDPGNPKIQASIDNFDQALNHPSLQDLNRLENELAKLNL